MNACLYMYIYIYTYIYIHTHISSKLLKRQAGVRPGWRLVAIDRAEEGAEELPEWQSRLKAPWMPWQLAALGIKHGYGSIPIHTIFRGMNIHLPAILMFTRGTRFWPTAISIHWKILRNGGCWENLEMGDPQITMVVEKSYSLVGHDLDDFRVPPWLRTPPFLGIEKCILSIQHNPKWRIFMVSIQLLSNWGGEMCWNPNPPGIRVFSFLRNRPTSATINTSHVHGAALRWAHELPLKICRRRSCQWRWPLRLWGAEIFVPAVRSSPSTTGFFKLPGMDWYDECMWHLNILMHVSI